MIPILYFGFIQIPTYFLVISLSLTALLIYLSSRVDLQGKDRKQAYNIALIIMIFGFIGGRLLHIFYEEFAYYKSDPLQVFYFWNGGFVFLGGLILAWLAVWVYCRSAKLVFLEWADFFAPLLSLSHALGRIGCVLSGCCFGKLCDLPWALAGRQPTAIYLAIGEVIIFFILLHLEKLNLNADNGPLGHLFFKWIFLHSLLRFFVEFYRADFRGVFLRLPGLGSLSVSQAICFILMLFALGFFVKSFLAKKS